MHIYAKRITLWQPNANRTAIFDMEPECSQIQYALYFMYLIGVDKIFINMVLKLSLYYYLQENTFNIIPALTFMPRWLSRFLESTGLLRRIFKTLKISEEESLCNKELQAVIAHNCNNFGMILTANKCCCSFLIKKLQKSKNYQEICPF